MTVMVPRTENNGKIHAHALTKLYTSRRHRLSHNYYLGNALIINSNGCRF